MTRLRPVLIPPRVQPQSAAARASDWALERRLVSAIDVNGSLFGGPWRYGGLGHALQPMKDGRGIQGGINGLVIEERPVVLTYPFSYITVLSRTNRTASNNVPAGLTVATNTLQLIGFQLASQQANRFVVRGSATGNTMIRTFSANSGTISANLTVLGATVTGPTFSEVSVFWNGVFDSGSSGSSGTITGSLSYDRHCLGGTLRPTITYSASGINTLLTAVFDGHLTANDHLTLADNWLTMYAPQKIWVPVSTPALVRHILEGVDGAIANAAATGAAKQKHKLNGTTGSTAHLGIAGVVHQTHALAGSGGVQVNEGTTGEIGGVRHVLGGEAGVQVNSGQAGALRQVHFLGGAADQQLNSGAVGVLVQGHKLAGLAGIQINLGSEGALNNSTNVLQGEAGTQVNSGQAGALRQKHSLTGLNGLQVNEGAAGLLRALHKLSGASGVQINLGEAGALGDVSHRLQGSAGVQENAGAAGIIRQRHKLLGLTSIQINLGSVGAINALVPGPPSGVVPFDYAAFRDEMESVIGEFGFTMSVKRFEDVVDKVEGTVSRVESQVQELRAVILPVNLTTIQALDARWMTDVLDDTNVRFCLMSASGATFMPRPKDVVEYWDGRKQVIGCTPVNVAGTAVIYAVGLKAPSEDGPKLPVVPSAFDYAAIRDEMKLVIEEFGFDMVVRRYADTVDSVEGEVTRIAEQKQTLTSVILPVNLNTIEALDARWMKDVLTDTDVRFCIMSATGHTFVPGVKDMVEYWDGKMQVLGCTPLNVMGIPVIFAVGLRSP